MRPDFQLAVVGGGIVGTLLTITFAEAGYKVLLIEKTDFHNRKVPSGRSFALSLSSCNYLQSLGFEKLLKEKGNPIKGVTITEGEAGKGSQGGILEFKPSEIGVDSFGCMIREVDLLAAIDERVRNEKLAKIIFKTEVQDVSTSLGSITLKSSEEDSFQTNLLAICDGKQESLRQNLAYTYVTKKYQQGAITCTVKHEKPNKGQAYQFFMPSGPIAFLPLSNHSVCVVWTNTLPEVNRISQMDDEDFLQELKPVFGTFLGELSLEGSRGSWPLEMSLAEEMIGNRFALLGDAARKIHPLAGQGLNLGLRDAAAFFEIVQTAKQRGEDIGFPVVLERYQRWRMFDSVAFATATDYFNWIYTRSFPGNQLFRQLGTGIISKITPLKTSLIKEAAGLSGDIPELMKKG